MEYSEAISRGEGGSVIRCWRYLLPVFRISRRKNYAFERLNITVWQDFTHLARQDTELI